MNARYCPVCSRLTNEPVCDCGRVTEPITLEAENEEMDLPSNLVVESKENVVD